MGCSLPNEYREFLVGHNGGRPVPYWFSYIDESGQEDTDGVSSLYGLGFWVPDYRNLQIVHQRFSGRIPPEILAIGDDPCGNQICIATQGERQGQLFLWNHEDEHTPPTYRNVIFLADTFNHFINGLHESQNNGITSLNIAIQKDNVADLEKLLAKDADLEETDQFGRTMLENAAIANALRAFEWLYSRGANPRNSLSLAQENARFFPEHERMVKLIAHLTQHQ
ncbi:SMI1/KNR4 family protein SUKH-1 [Aquabacterium commune]|uniref:SMI1/KNR4 family protein SUKH-1 n=2 Tax=Aquabacterium commune TaxID=70586 RepID=A0A4R6REU0_9BURK|nr:SMI1/KNR4 family protein SUKH-1 [Aquabacterium commune]